MLLPAFGEIGAADAGGEFGPQRQALAAAILEAVHLLGDDVGRLADRAGEDLGRLEHRHLDPAEAVEPADAVERLHHRLETVGGFAPDILGSPDLLRTFAHRAAHLACLPGGESGAPLDRRRRDAPCGRGAFRQESAHAFRPARPPSPLLHRRRRAASRQFHQRDAGAEARHDPACARRPLSRHDPADRRRDRHASAASSAVHEHVPVAKAGDFVLLYPKWLPGNHSPSGQINKVAGFRVDRQRPRAAPGCATRSTSTPSTSTCPQGVRAIDVDFQYVSPTGEQPGPGRR